MARQARVVDTLDVGAFGKPLGEDISSFWCGLLLGIISYNTQSIWGGLIVHLGIAWLMEAGSWLGLLFKK